MFAFAKDPAAVAPDDLQRAQRLPDVTSSAPARTGASLSLEGVSLTVTAREGQVEILREVALDVSAGEFLCVLGPSGSGKSTLLNLIAGFAAPTSGRLRCAGKDIVAPGPDRAVVFQDAALFPWLTLEHNVEFPMKIANVPREERAKRGEELLRLVHLWRFRERYPHELSGGMRQRGAIARALATDPSVLLMDEPFAALDAQTREILQGEVERIWKATRKTVIFVTHNVREAVRLADRVVLMGTRPGHVLHEEYVELPRPREATDARVGAITTSIGRRIASEVEKVARQEADEAWIAPGQVRGDPRRQRGRGI